MRFAPAALRRGLTEWLAVTVGVVLLASAAAYAGWAWRADAALYDVALSLSPRPVPEDVVVIGIDDASLAEIGRWPWPRRLHAALLERLTEAGTRAVAMDLILSEAAPADDAALATAMARHGSVVLPVLHESGAGAGRGEILPAPRLAEAAAGFGHIVRITDPDGIVRRAETWRSDGRVARPHLALALLGMTDPERYLAVGTERVPLLIPFAGPPGSYRHHSYTDVLHGRVPEAALRGRTVLVGPTATGLSDNYPTPVSGGEFDMPGVEIHATLYDALRGGRRIVQAPPALAALLTAVSLLALFSILRRSSPFNGLLASSAHGLVWLAGPAAALHVSGYWLPPAAALLGSALAYPLWSWRRLAAAQLYMAGEIDALSAETRGLPGAMPAPAPGGSDPFARQVRQIQAAIGQLRAARRFVQQVVDALPVGVAVADAGERLLLVNSKLPALLEQAAGASSLAGLLEGLRWPDGVPPTWGKAGHAQADTPGGHRLLLSWVACRWDGDTGGDAAEGLILAIDDISALRDAQRAQERSLQFLAHDLRSPLVSILALVERPEADRARIAMRARAALDLADGFTSLAKAEAADPARFRETDLALIADEALDIAWEAAQAKGIVLEREFAVETAPVRGDPSLLRRALGNLVDNAIRYSPEKTRVVLRLDAEGNGWRVDILDQGRGIDAAGMERLFRPFVRLQAAEYPEVPGTGLGLAMVKATADSHGGRVEVASEPGRGSRFSILLPAA